jgi:hypothetical protein
MQCGGNFWSMSGPSQHSNRSQCWYTRFSNWLQYAGEYIYDEVIGINKLLSCLSIHIYTSVSYDALRKEETMFLKPRIIRNGVSSVFT